MGAQNCTTKTELKNKPSQLILNSYNIPESVLFHGIQDMINQYLYTQIRRDCLVDGKSKRKAARDYGVHRESVEKALIYNKPPGYRRTAPIKYPVLLEQYRNFILEIIELDKQAPIKQRHTAKRIYDRLKEELQYTGGYDSVKRYVASQKEKLNLNNMYVPLDHPLGEAQADFGHCKVKIKGKLQKGYFIAIKLSNSDDTFVAIYPIENLVTWCDGHARAFEYFGGVPNQIIYDNSTCLVKKILFNGGRELTNGFLELRSHYLFKAEFCAPAKGNEKGKVESGVKYIKRNYLTPVPDCDSWEELNDYLLKKSLDRRRQKQANKEESIGDLFISKDKPFLLPLPLDKYESYETKFAKVNTLSLITYRCNVYSVPTEYGGCQVIVKGYHDKVVISYKDKVLASHKRLYDKNGASYNPLHYLDLIERKIRSLDQARPLKVWNLPKEFEKLRRILESRDKTAGKREYVKVLKLIGQYNMTKVAQGIKAAVSYGCTSYDGILMCIRQINQIPITNLKELRVSDIHVPKADLSAYMQLGV